MRSLSCLAVAVAALSSFACGAPATGGGNEYVTQGLEGVNGGDDADTGAPTSLVTVSVDGKDQGCTVDGVRFERCVLTRTSTADVAGLSLNLCELQVDDGTYTWECDVDPAAAFDHKELPWHCPSGH